MTEIWKDIEGYEGQYQVSNLGRVKSLERYVVAKHNSISRRKEKILRAGKTPDGYLTVALSKNNILRTYPVHRLVAMAFLADSDMSKTQVNHINGKKTDNNVENLEWVTQKENLRHAIQTGLNGVEHWRNNKSSIPVVQYDDDSNFIARYPSMNEAARQNNTYASKIRYAIQRKIKTCGFFWCIEE